MAEDCDPLGDGIRDADEVELRDFQQITISVPGFEPRTITPSDGVVTLADVIREAFRYPAN